MRNSVSDETARDETVSDETVSDETARDETVSDETARQCLWTGPCNPRFRTRDEEPQGETQLSPLVYRISGRGLIWRPRFSPFR